LSALVWIILSGLLMSTIALIGGLLAFFSKEFFKRLLLPIVALVAGTLLGGAFFHMIPEGSKSLSSMGAYIWLLAGFVMFLLLEQLLHWHHSHNSSQTKKKPFTYLILIGDAIHNFIGGISIAGTYLISPSAGVMAWIAGAMHEIPQEIGDFGVLIHGGWSRRQALLWNFISALTFPIGGVLVYFVSFKVDVSGLVLLGAGNFIYIAASDLIPEIKSQPRLKTSLIHFGSFMIGLLMMIILALIFNHH